MLSKSSKYALKAVLYLAKNSNETRRVMVKDMAKPIDVPQAYIAKLLQKLSKLGLISSIRGPKGGFYLSLANKEQSVLNIIYAIDGSEKLNSCLLSLKECNALKPCPLHDIANPSRLNLIAVLREQTIANLALDIKKGNSFLSK
jgi:Rrf2 family protein